jgi:hypothetical protein
MMVARISIRSDYVIIAHMGICMATDNKHRTYFGLTIVVIPTIINITTARSLDVIAYCSIKHKFSFLQKWITNSPD